MRNGESASFLQTPPMSLWDASSLSWRGSDFAQGLSEEQLQGPSAWGCLGGPVRRQEGKAGGWAWAEPPGCPRPSPAQLWAALSSPVGVELPALGARGRFGVL